MFEWIRHLCKGKCDKRAPQGQPNISFLHINLHIYSLRIYKRVRDNPPHDSSWWVCLGKFKGTSEFSTSLCYISCFQHQRTAFRMFPILLPIHPTSSGQGKTAPGLYCVRLPCSVSLSSQYYSPSQSEPSPST